MNWDLLALQKWPPGAVKPINLFEGRFPNDAIFYHSPSRSLYFFHMTRNNPGVNKLPTIDESSTAVNVINASGQGSGLNQLSHFCRGIYVTLSGDIFILDAANSRIVK